MTGDLQWEHRRDLPEDVYDFVGGNARNNRNIAIYDRLIINTSDDDYAVGLDATTGEIAWETQIFDYTVTPAGHSSGPIMADGKVISGRSCRPLGGRLRRRHRSSCWAARTTRTCITTRRSRSMSILAKSAGTTSTSMTTGTWTIPSSACSLTRHWRQTPAR